MSCFAWRHSFALIHLKSLAKPNVYPDMLQAEKFEQAEATAFDSSRLVDFSEEIVCDAPAVLHSPLTTSPGRLVISPQRLHFQPKHDVSGQMPCHSHPLSLIAAISRRRAVLRPTGEAVRARVDCV